MKYEEANAIERRIDDSLSIKDLFSDMNFAFDCVIANISGDHPKVRNRISDRCYYILSGEAEVLVGSDWINAKQGDLVAINKNTIHSIKGNARYLIITAPPFDPNNEEIIE